MTTTPEPADKLDATTNIAANGPTDGTLAPASESYGAAATGPSPACLSRMLGNGHVLVLRGARHSNVPGLPGRWGRDRRRSFRRHPHVGIAHLAESVAAECGVLEPDFCKRYEEKPTYSSV